MKHLRYMFTTYAFSATWAGGATNWRGGGGPAIEKAAACKARAGASNGTGRQGVGHEAWVGRVERSVRTDGRPLRSITVKDST